MQRPDVLKVIYPRADAVRGRRFTQDTAIIPDVWIAFGTAEDLSQRIELLLTPHASSDVQTLLRELRPRLARERGPDASALSLPYNESHVLVKANYAELIRAILPLSSWWQHHIAPLTLDSRYLDRLASLDDLEQLLFEPGYQDLDGNYPEALLDLVRITGAIALGKPRPPARDVVAAFAKLAAGIEPAKELPQPPPLWSVFCNRKAQGAITQSRLAVKADAAVRLFDVSAKGLVWAVVDSGIDARHPAFSRPAAGQAAASISSRVLRTYNFTRLKDLMSSNFEGDGRGSVFDQLSDEVQREVRRDLQHRLTAGQPLDWKLLDPLLQVPHTCAGYQPPENEHGTHVAGILAADWKRDAGDLKGICPDLEMYDLRVFDKNGEGDEFAILAALQFVRFLNQSKDRTSIHGVNLSFSLPHAVDSFGCGSTPVCEECDRLAGSGVVVVAAAGNRGYRNNGDQFEDYRNISITDPGNADAVITVGATHRYMPHKYGVSYFSSRGPTGDGRLKPDLVAPGEKIESTIPGGGCATLDGTSMAAPHVSGAAALLMARHRELIGKPVRVKEVLLRTATDLGRDRSFQGAGMLDVLRALQSV